MHSRSSNAASLWLMGQTPMCLGLYTAGCEVQGYVGASQPSMERMAKARLEAPGSTLCSNHRWSTLRSSTRQNAFNLWDCRQYDLLLFDLLLRHLVAPVYRFKKDRVAVAFPCSQATAGCIVWLTERLATTLLTCCSCSSTLYRVNKDTMHRRLLPLSSLGKLADLDEMASV